MAQSFLLRRRGWTRSIVGVLSSNNRSPVSSGVVGGIGDEEVDTLVTEVGLRSKMSRFASLLVAGQMTCSTFSRSR